MVGAALAYFAVRGMTEGAVARADRNASLVLRLERALHLDHEQGLQDLLLDHDAWVTLANWVYIWIHWPVIVVTLLWLLFAHRDDYRELRNAMFVSGAIGLLIFATFPVTPPRLVGLEYVDTVTERSVSYRVLQPPALVNKYAAIPSLHFGWNLLVGYMWFRVGRRAGWKGAAIVMPIAMGWAVVATGNHWVTDVAAGAVVALTGLGIVRWRRTRADRTPTSSAGHLTARAPDVDVEQPTSDTPTETCTPLPSAGCSPSARSP